MLQERLAAHRRLVPPTALLETGFLSRQQQQDHELAVLAKIALDKLVHEWRFEYGYVPPGQIGVVQQVAREIRWRGLLPDEEKHDSLIVAEAALLNAVLLVTDDSMMRAIERLPLDLLMSEFHLHAPLIVTPREIVRQFSR